MGVFSDLDDYNKSQLCAAALDTHKWAEQAVAKMLAPGTPDYEYWLHREGLGKFKRTYRLKGPTVIIPRALVPEEMLGDKVGEVKQINVAEIVAMGYAMGGAAAGWAVEEAIRAAGGMPPGLDAPQPGNRAARRAENRNRRPVFPPIDWAAPEQHAPAPQIFVDEFNPEDPF